MLEDFRRPEVREVEVSPKSPALKAVELMFVSPDLLQVVEKFTQNPDSSGDFEAFQHGVTVVNRSNGVQYRFNDRGDNKEVIEFRGEPGYEHVIDVEIDNGEMYVEKIDRRLVLRARENLKTVVPSVETEKEIMEFAMRFFEGSSDRVGRGPYDRKASPEFQYAMLAQGVLASRFVDEFGYRPTTGINKSGGKWGIHLSPRDVIDEAVLRRISGDLGIIVTQSRMGIVVAH